MIKNIFFIVLLSITCLAENIKISNLPLGSGALVGSSDSFPYVQASNLVTKRLTIYDLVNVPQFVATYAPIASPTFTGTVTIPTLNVTTITGTTLNLQNLKAATSAGLAVKNSSGSNVAVFGAGPGTGIVTSGDLTVAGNASISGNVNGAAVWNASTITVAKGGTGLTAQGTQYQTFQAGASSPAYDAVHLNQAAAVTGVLPNANTTAASSNTASAIVTRDSSGNFSAGTITASLTGTASGNTTYTANNHGVVVSSSTNAMTVVAPAASSGVALLSGGSSADPAYGVLGIAGGGTGASAKAAGFDALSPMTTGGDLVYGGTSGTGTRLANGSSGQFLMSNGGTTAPSWASPSISLTNPTVQKFTSGSGTYTRPTSPTPIYLVVTMCGGGGGGGGNGTSATTGGSGGNTTFGNATAFGGAGGTPNNTTGGIAGGSILGLGYIGQAASGTDGDNGTNITSFPGGNGGNSIFGGRGRAGLANAGGVGLAGNSAQTNSCSGGGGAGSGSLQNAAGGGGSGGWLKAIIVSPGASAAYSVGASGAFGVAGTNGANGGSGGAGFIMVEEYYQ